MTTDTDAFLEHYGVLGMKWGVHKSRAQRRSDRETRKDERWSAKRDRANIRIGRYSSKNVHEVMTAARKSMRSDLKALNKSPKYNTREAKKLIKEGRNPTAIQYQKDVSDIYMKHVKAVAPNHMQVSPSGKWEESLVIGSNYWDVQLKRVDSVTHSSVSDPDISMRVRPIFDNDGYIIDVEIVTDDLKQSSLDVDTFLEHYGVLGMKWGVHNSKKRSGSERQAKRTLSPNQRLALVGLGVGVAAAIMASSGKTTMLDLPPAIYAKPIPFGAISGAIDVKSKLLYSK